MLGIKFKIPNLYDIVLNKILENIDLDDYIIKIEEEEVWGQNECYFFNKEVYLGVDFKKNILQIHYPIFLNLQFYFNNYYHNQVINDYEDFLKCECQLILFITDNESVEVYSKNINFLKTIKENAIKNNFIDIVDIENKIDIRGKFSAYY